MYRTGISLAAKTLLLFGEGWPPAGVESVLWYMGFTQTYSAPLTSPHTAALDGDLYAVGQAVLVQTDGQYSTSGGNLVIPAQATAAWGDQGFIGKDAGASGFARAAGLAFVATINIASSTGLFLGLGDGTGTSYSDQADDFSSFNFAGAAALTIVPNAGGNRTVGAWDASANRNVVVIVRPTKGYFLFYNNKLIYVVDEGTQATLYPYLANLTGVATMPTAMLAQLNTNMPTVYPVPLLADTFSDSSAPYVSDGVLINGESDQGGDGITHVSGTFWQAGGVLGNSPTPGAELLVDGDMEAADTSAWVTGASATLSKETGTPHGGSNVLRVARNGINNPYCYQSVLTAGTFTRVIGYARSDGAAIPRMADSVYRWIGTNSTSWQSVAFVTRAGSAAIAMFAYTSSGTEYCEFDDFEAKPLTLSGLLTGSSLITEDNPRWQALLDPDSGYQCGVAMFLDSLSSPTKGVIVYQDTNDSKVKVWDIGAASELSATAITPSAGAQLQVGHLSDGKLYWVYNNTTAANVAYTPTASAEYCALFDTGSPTGAITQAALWQGDQCSGLGAIV